MQDTAAKLNEIRSLVEKLDIPVRQVLVESRVVIANDDFARDLGVRFGFNRQNGGDKDSILTAGGMPGHTAGTYGIAPGIENPAGSGMEALMVNLPNPYLSASTPNFPKTASNSLIFGLPGRHFAL